jgi:cytochrome d ubiquinol oxidase subunit II
VVTFWFIAIALLFTGFLVLEGFDFGVGMLHTVVGRSDAERKVAIGTIGPLWDGNEVWLVVAGAAMFAAFPGWYATMFSGFYLAIVLLLVALIARGVSFEFRERRDGERWGRTWDTLMTAGSLLAPLLIGVALGNLLNGVPIDSRQEFTGSFWSLLNPYSVYVGVTIVLVCVLHGSTFMALKAGGEVRRRAGQLARRSAPVAALAVLAFAVWTQVISGSGVIPGPVQLIAVLALIAVTWLLRDGREGWAFTMTTVAMATVVLTIFVDLYPRVMVSSTSAANNLTVHNTASGPYALKVMTVVLAVLLPVVVAYQAWTYYVFRRRVGLPDHERRLQAPERAAAQAEAEAVRGPRSG